MHAGRLTTVGPNLDRNSINFKENLDMRKRTYFMCVKGQTNINHAITSSSWFTVTSWREDMSDVWKIGLAHLIDKMKAAIENSINTGDLDEEGVVVLALNRI